MGRYYGHVRNWGIKRRAASVLIAGAFDPKASCARKLAKNRRCKSPTGKVLANRPDPE